MSWIDPARLEQIMTADEVCAFLKIPLSTLYSLTKRGKIRGAKIGKHWRYMKEDIMDYLLGPSRRQGRSGFQRPAKEVVPEQPKITERRLYPRVSCRLPARMRILMNESEETAGRGNIQNLSRGGGLYLNETGSGRKPAVGDVYVIQIEILMNGSKREVSAKIEIIHQHDPDSTYGFRFREMDSDYEKIIQDYLD